MNKETFERIRKEFFYSVDGIADGHDWLDTVTFGFYRARTLDLPPYADWTDADIAGAA